jgi:hypothetical protein
MPRVSQIGGALGCATDSMSTGNYSVLTHGRRDLESWEMTGLNAIAIRFQQSPSFDLGANRNLKTGMQASSN